MKNCHKTISMMLSLALLLFAACSKEEGNGGLQNALIKKSLGPNLVGQEIVLAYSMGTTSGKLATAKVVASIPGDTDTGFEPYSWHTSTSGAEVPVTVAEDCITEGVTSSAVFIDTAAATLRYFYRIPEEARGKEVSFTFSATSSNGESVSYQAGPFLISNMDMVRDIPLRNNGASYVSIRDMKAYTWDEVTADPSLAAAIDLVYLYRVKEGVNFGHALVSPSATAYLEGAAVPSDATNSSKIEKQVNIRDQQLSGLQYAVFVDDIDFRNLNINNAANFILNLKTDEGAFVETDDGRYRAFLYMNAVNTDESATISIKRLRIN